MINNASLDLTDVLFATPVVMGHILDTKQKFKFFDINPKTIIVDEFDELMSNPQHSGFVLKILEKFCSTSSEVNRQRQLILCGSTIPKEFYEGGTTCSPFATSSDSVIDSLKSSFEGLEHVKTENAHRISALLDHDWIDLKKSLYNDESSYIPDEAQELGLLVNIVRQSLEDRKDKSIIIFAENRKTVDKICEVLMQAEIKSMPYYADIHPQGRLMSLNLL